MKVTAIGILNEFGLQGIFVKEGTLQSLGLLSQAYPVIMVKVKPGVSASAVSIQARTEMESRERESIEKSRDRVSVP